MPAPAPPAAVVHEDQGGDAMMPIDLDGRLNDLESGLLAWALEKAEGNKSKAALLLTISRSTFGDRLSRSHRTSSADLSSVPREVRAPIGAREDPTTAADVT